MFRTYSISPRLNRISLLALSMHGLGVEERENPNKKTFFICVIQGERQISVIDRSRWVIRQVIACSRLRRVFLGWDIDNGDGFSDWLRWFSFQFSLYSLHDFPHSLSLPGARRYDLHIFCLNHSFVHIVAGLRRRYLQSPRSENDRVFVGLNSTFQMMYGYEIPTELRRSLFLQIQRSTIQKLDIGGSQCQADPKFKKV